MLLDRGFLDSEQNTHPAHVSVPRLAVYILLSVLITSPTPHLPSSSWFHHTPFSHDIFRTWVQHGKHHLLNCAFLSALGVFSWITLDSSRSSLVLPFRLSTVTSLVPTASPECYTGVLFSEACLSSISSPGPGCSTLLFLFSL